MQWAACSGGRPAMCRALSDRHARARGSGRAGPRAARPLQAVLWGGASNTVSGHLESSGHVAE